MIIIALSPILEPTRYLDPGSGSFIIQMLIAGLLGLSVAVRIYWRKIKLLFKKSPTNVDTPNDTEEDEE